MHQKEEGGFDSVNTQLSSSFLAWLEKSAQEMLPAGYFEFWMFGLQLRNADQLEIVFRVLGSRLWGFQALTLYP